MALRLDKTLALWIDVEVQFARFSSPKTSRGRLRRIALAEFEERGFAMRHLRSDGEIGWRATPKLHEHLRDAELDATDDLERARH